MITIIVHININFKILISAGNMAGIGFFLMIILIYSNHVLKDKFKKKLIIYNL